MSATWTVERTEALKHLWAQGLSAGEIAGRLGGVTRNAVIGKAMRLGLPKRVAPTRLPRPLRTPPPAASTSRPRSLPPPPLPTAAADDIVRTTLADLEPHECKWPVGDPRASDFGFCGLDRVRGLPYCASHARRAYAAVEPAVSATPAPVLEAAE